MNKLALFFIINTILIFYSCDQAKNDEAFDGEKIEMTSKEGIDLSLQINALCEKTGLVNINPNFIDCYKMYYDGYSYYYCKANLQAMGKSMLYQITMDKKKRIVEFMPSTPLRLNFDSEPEVISEYEREEVLKAVARVSKLFGKKYYGNGAIEKAREYYLARCSVISEEERGENYKKGNIALDPFNFYYFTKDMKVFGIMCGAYCFRDMEKD
jgi:hypothetical protein